MTQRFYKIIVVGGLLSMSILAQSQKYHSPISQVPSHVPISTYYCMNSQNELLKTIKQSSLPIFPLALNKFTNPVVKKNFYTEHLAFFCHKEWKLEKATGISLRIRMGSLQQCNFLEGKKAF